MTFGARLRQRMEALRLDETQLAARLRVHVRTVERYVERDRPPNRRAIVEAMANALGVPVEWLETGKGPEELPGRKEEQGVGGSPASLGSLPSIHPEHEPPGRYAGLREVASNVVWEMRDGEHVLYAVRVSTLVAQTRSVEFTVRDEGPASAPLPTPRQARSAA